MTSTAPCPPSGIGGEASLPREDIQFSLPKGAAITHGTVDPREFLGGATPALDRRALGKLDDEGLKSKILRSSLTACIALGEHARRFDEWRLQKAQQEESFKKLIHDNAEAMRQMAQLERDLQQARAEAEKAANEKAKVEKAVVEAAKKASEDAGAAKAEAAAGAVAAFMTEDWKAEGNKDWVASVVESSADGWVKGPGAMWLARKGEDYYAGGEFFTQALIYRRLARHLKIEPMAFDPAAYGLPPPLQPDIRVPLPEGVESPELEDSELLKEAEGDEAEADTEVISKPSEEAAPGADNI
ncbi:unnamed protein product [Cuscuta europaea]|uniref:Uncharacterized protein n=1 Tax=Cuscuta europaea TaxID=41803 RepID=A0A9P0YZP1_CUSEU|nr:unnamed protein product [Cuscuta europaea]